MNGLLSLSILVRWLTCAALLVMLPRPATAQAPAEARRQLIGLQIPFTTSAFLGCARESDLVAVKLFLSAGMNPDAADDDGNTALMLAAGRGHEGVVRTLLPLHVALDRTNRTGETALVAAAKAGRLNLVELLLEAGADGDGRWIDSNGRSWSALSAAVAANQSAVVRALLAHGATVRPSDGLGDAFLQSVMSGDVPMASAWLRAGVSPDTRAGASGAPALSLAIRFNRPALVDLLLERGADLRAGAKDGTTPLMQALARTEPDALPLAERLITKGAAVDGRDTSGATALYRATVGRRTDLIRWLLAHGAAVDAPTNAGLTALMVAADSGAVEPLSALLGAKADPNAANVRGNTALLFAARSNRPAAVRALLAAGADPNAANTDGNTPLMAAAWSGAAEIARLLLAAGADPARANTDGWTALRWAVEQDRPDLVALLRANPR